MDTKKTIGFILLVIAVGLLIALIPKGEINAPVTDTNHSVIDGIDGDGLLKQNIPGQNSLDTDTPKELETTPLSDSPKDIAWATFQQYLKYNRDNDLEGVKSIVYKIAPICEDLKDIIDCKARMSSAYAYGKDLNKNDFVNVWSDDKQIILSTNFKIEEDKNFLGRNRAIIYFIRDAEGLKLLSFSPFKGIVISKGEASRKELDDRIIIFTEDRDQDGIADYSEECLDTKKETCTKTDPKVRDTDGDGLWDGTEDLMDLL